MALEKVKFKNKNGQELEGRIEFPNQQHPQAFAIFAHCFTCGKNLKSIKYISMALADAGIGVLRFDFTGLGQSEGDFEDTDFSHNIEDLIEASDFLEKNYQAPSLLIGHSLGGTAALFAAKQLDNIKAVVSIASPCNPEHVKNLINTKSKNDNSESISINIGGRDFKIKRKFLQDIENMNVDSFLNDLKKPYLIFHSPQDKIVGIENAEKLYTLAHHPKSFVSLDQADHLLSDSQDSKYTGGVIAAWTKRYLNLESPPEIKSNSEVAATLKKEDKFTTPMKVGDFQLIGDEPKSLGGHNFGPSPYEMLSAGLAECTAMTIQMYVRRKNWDMKEVKVHINHNKKEIEDSDGKTQKVDVFKRKIECIGDLDDEQKQRIIKIADKCPVHRTLIHNEVKVNTELL
ncbi:bifunctional alpha/beta hydrolase/OsmC family protein [Psychroflexus aestuariivivens]|uniref:bifunctional alpha/beta hydrolase/OsmC family protein n=1 Tax=Psychroflexus aestuariivivens TaxID=1795040 RepID=UPI000FDAF26A|nr:bifunctional alpha/beta hydrolase/OsmC family protein [Psychroflexus aestuariivivens]